MQYLSVEWLAWMIACFSLYWLSPERFRHWVLAAVTALFIGILSPESLLLLTGFTGITLAYLRHGRASGRLLVVASLGIIATLVHYKLGVVSLEFSAIVEGGLIPLGLSYYSFRCLHLMFERYRGRFGDATNAEVTGYLFFLPTIVVGPIHRFGAYQRDRYRGRIDAAMLGEGLERISYGFVKIGFLGNYLISGQLGGLVAAMPAGQASLQAYLWIAQGGLNLYFQFSGFADIAIGFSRLLGFRVMENFNWPFLKPNLSEYWRAWHISLTSWCREYVYTSVVSWTRSPALGAITTLLIIGLWHELSLRFILWGLFHGLGLVVWQQFQRLKPHLPAPRGPIAKQALYALSVIFTVHYVWFGFALIRTDTPLEAMEIWWQATLGFLF